MRDHPWATVALLPRRLVPPISSMFLGLGLGRITVRITKLRDFFTCLIAAREPEPSDEKLTLKPVGGSSDEEWDLWDHLNHLYNDGLVSYFNQIWTTYQDKHAKLTRNRVDLSYGVATTGKNAEQAESVFGERLVPCPWQWHAAAAAGGH